MDPILEFIWLILFLIIVMGITYSALQRIDFSKIFKANSTWQINILTLFISICVGFLCSKAILEIIRLSVNIINR